MVNPEMDNGKDKIINTCYWLFDPDIINDKKYAQRIESAIEKNTTTLLKSHTEDQGDNDIQRPFC